MKFQPDRAEGVNLIARQEAGRLWVSGQWFEHSVLVPWQGAVAPWTAREGQALGPQDFEPLLALRPEVVILGSGARLRFAHPSAYRALIEARIGLETMDTAAACRTYNVLASEGRTVVAALMI